MNESKLYDVEMVVGVLKVHVLDIEAYFAYQLVRTMQQPLVGLAQMIIQLIKLSQGKLGPMVEMPVISHVGFSNLGFLHQTHKVVFATTFPRSFHFGSIPKPIKAPD
jgi:hypothetical protein